MSEAVYLPEGIRVQNSFVRGRNVLIAQADFSALFVDFYIHLQEYQISASEALVEAFKPYLAAVTLHAASHPRNEVLAWTLHFQQPHWNFFFAADTQLSTVTGRFFTEGLRQEDTNLFYQDLVVLGKPPHRSIVSFEGVAAESTVARFYAQSEQRPGKFFHLQGDQYALLAAHPDWDENWFDGLDRENVIELCARETIQDIESRQFRWLCGCSHERIRQILKAPMAADPDALFGDQDVIQVNCPRCAARYSVGRAEMQAVVASS